MGTALWDRTYGGIASDVPEAIAVLPDGGFALAGSTQSKGAGFRDFWLVRTDSDGTLLWDRTYGGHSEDRGGRFAVLIDGGFALVGTTQSKGDGKGDAWLVRTDSEGAPLWDKTYGGPEYDFGFAVAVLPDGGFALLGATQSKGSGNEDCWLIRTDPWGTLLWDKIYGGSGWERCSLITVLPDGGLALSGFTSSKGAGATDAWLVRTDASGTLLWDQTYGGPAGDSASSVAVLPYGGFAFAGTTYSNGAGNTDVWLVRTDSEGNASCP